MIELVCLALFLPLSGFLIALLFSDWIDRPKMEFIACGAVFISLLCFTYFFFAFYENHIDSFSFSLFSWIPIKSMETDFKLYVDQLSIWMALLITGIGFLIHIYSIGYMDHEEDVIRYFGCLNFFIFAMLLLVLAGNLVVLFVGWEGVGLASYLLIGFWYARPGVSSAATKAFIINRIGDLGLLLAILLAFYLFGTTDLIQISEKSVAEGSSEKGLLTVLALLLFMAAIGKSAQLPLHTWLPDAMAGPTPVSALIHAATMVTAGVYLIVRLHPLYLQVPFALNVVAIVGGITSLFAALCAVGQTDLKRVLAFSTVSQLGLMFMACGVGAFYSAMFHLTTHAFMKALLFLSAGNVVHMMSGNTDMETMGGLSSKLKYTHWLFFIGVLAMSGIPPLAAFFSKDLILEVVGDAGYYSLLYVGLAASLLTAFYLMRAYSLTFLGDVRVLEKEDRSISEAPFIMLFPVVILAFFSIFGGFIGSRLEGVPLLQSFLSIVGLKQIEKELTTHFIWTHETVLATIGAVVALLCSAFIYTKFPKRFIHYFNFLKEGFFVDAFYDRVFVNPIKAFSRFINDWFEPKFFLGALNHSVGAIDRISRQMQKIQSGQIRSYAAWLFIGVAVLVVYLVL